MLVYRTFFKIVKKNMLAITIYLAVFIVMIVIIADNGGMAPEVFTDEKLEVAVIDRDGSDISNAIYKFLDNTQTVADIGDDTDLIQDALFFRQIKYLLTIPAGFGESFLEDGDIRLETTKTPGSYNGTYVDMQLQEYLATLRAYLGAGLDFDEAVEMTMANLTVTTDVQMAVADGKTNNAAPFAFYYQFLAYALTAIMTHMMATVMYVFNEKEVARRMKCSSTPLRSKSFQMTLGCCTVAAATWVLLIALSFVKYGGDLTGSAILPYLLGNTIAMTTAAAAIGFLVGNIVKKQDNISVYSVSVSMICSFLGGVFVPQSMISDGILKFARLLPSYWYILLNDELAQSSSVTAPLNDMFLSCTGLQLAFAVVVFSIGLLVSKKNSSAQ